MKELTRAPEPLPLREDPDGVVRIGQTRVPLDTVAQAFSDGATPEEIAQQYSTLQLADVYAVIAFSPLEVTAYLQRRKQERAGVLQQNADLLMPMGLRERLLARRAAS
jgi:uncharacterized protein (DUF433 family)